MRHLWKRIASAVCELVSGQRAEADRTRAGRDRRVALVIDVKPHATEFNPADPVRESA